MGTFWGSDRKQGSITKGFLAELFCCIQMEITQLEERASKFGFGWLVRGVACMPFIWLNIALLGTAGWGQKVSASAEGKPMHFCLLSVSCSARDLEGLSFKHSKGEGNYLFNWSFGCYQVFFLFQGLFRQMAGADNIAHKKQYRFNSSAEWMWLQFVLSVVLMFLFSSSLWFLLRSSGDFFCAVKETVGRLF